MVDILKEYISKRIELLKLEASEKSSVGSGFVVFLLLSFAAISFFVLMLNIGVGLLIGHYLGNYGYGVLIVSAFYLLLFFILLLTRKALMRSVANIIIDFLND